jgi:hypothetical protein
VAPTDVSNEQYSAAQLTATAAHNSCSVPHGSDLATAEANLAAAQARGAAQNTTQTKSTPKGQTHGGTATANATTAGSLPSDPSKHT